MEELDEADIALEEAAGEEAVGGVAAGATHIGAVGFECRGRFTADIGEVRDGGLHAEGHLVGFDAGQRFGVAGADGFLAIQLGQVVEEGAALIAINTGRVGQIEHGICARTQRDALMRRGQKTIAPEAGEDWLAGILARTL
jgi:hypothetical protein